MRTEQAEQHRLSRQEANKKKRVKDSETKIEKLEKKLTKQNRGVDASDSDGEAAGTTKTKKGKRSAWDSEDDEDFIVDDDSDEESQDEESDKDDEVRRLMCTCWLVAAVDDLCSIRAGA